MLAINFNLVPRTSVFNASATTGAETPGEADVVDMGGGRFFFAYGNDYDQGTGGDSAGLRYEVHRRGDSTPVSSGSLDTPGDQSDVALTTFPGAVAAVFTTKEFNPNGEIYLQIFDSLGVPAFPAQDLPFPAASDVNSNPDIALLSTGNFAVVWNSVHASGDSDAEVRIVNATGVDVVGFPIEITGDEFGLTFDQPVQVRNPVVAALANDRFVVAYQYNFNQGSPDGLAYLIYSGGTLPPVIINSGIGQNNDQAAIAALSDGGFAIAHRNTISGDENVLVSVANADGSIRHFNTLANVDGTNGNQFDPAITAFENGYFLVSWTSDVGFTESIKARLFDSQGNGVGPVLTIASSIFGHVGQSALETTFPESFMAAWSDTNAPRPGVDGPDTINAQEFDFVRRIESDDSADTLTGYGLRDDMFGNGGNDLLIGAAGDDILDGGAGSDRMVGGPGNDAYFVDSFGDAVTELPGEGSDTVYATSHYLISSNVENLVLQGSTDLQGYGNAASNALYGNVGNNILNGDLGADLMVGGAGNDAYFVDNAGDTVVENPGEGTDTVYSAAHFRLAPNVENLILQGNSDLQGYGNASVNAIYGNAGNNILNGDAGADLMVGGTGNDSYFVDDVADSPVEFANEGNDTVYATSHFRLVANVENLILQGSADRQGFGNSLNNVIYGNAGNNLIDGDGGADIMVGGAGNDTYFVDNGLDQVFENAAEGADAVFSSVHFILPANVETLVLQGSAAANGTGNALANALFGNSADNVLDGQGGADVLTGGAGNDNFTFIVGQGNGDNVVDFAGNGAAAGDSLRFIGYGAGATFTNIDATHWQLNYNSGSSHEVITFMNGASIDASDYSFI